MWLKPQLWGGSSVWCVCFFLKTNSAGCRWHAAVTVWCLYLLLVMSTNFTQSDLYVYMFLVPLFCTLWRVDLWCEELTVWQVDCKPRVRAIMSQLFTETCFRTVYWICSYMINVKLMLRALGRTSHWLWNVFVCMCFDLRVFITHLFGRSHRELLCWRLTVAHMEYQIACYQGQSEILELCWDP